MTQTPPNTSALSFEKSAIPLVLELKPSRLHTNFNLGAHLAAITAVWLTALPPWWPSQVSSLPNDMGINTVRVLVSTIIAISCWYNFHRDRHRQQLTWHRDNFWSVKVLGGAMGKTAKSVTIDAALDEINFFSRWLVIITLSPFPPNTNDDTVTDISEAAGQQVTTLLARVRPKRKLKYLIPYDSLDPQTFRLLRVRLRIEGDNHINETDQRG